MFCVTLLAWLPSWAYTSIPGQPILSDHPRPGRSQRNTRPLSETRRERDREREAWTHRERERERERETARAYSQLAADEREALLNTTHKVYIDRSLALSGAKTICQQG